MKRIITIEENYRVFNIEVDIEKLLEEAEEIRDSWDDEYPYSRLHADIDEYVTKEEFDEEMRQMIIDIENLRNPETIRSLIDEVGRKKDGYFAKGRIAFYKQYSTTAHYIQECYGWSHNCIRIKSNGPNTACITMSREIQKY